MPRQSLEQLRSQLVDLTAARDAKLEDLVQAWIAVGAYEARIDLLLERMHAERPKPGV